MKLLPFVKQTLANFVSQMKDFFLVKEQIGENM